MGDLRMKRKINDDTYVEVDDILRILITQGNPDSMLSDMIELYSTEEMFVLYNLLGEVIEKRKINNGNS